MQQLLGNHIKPLIIDQIAPKLLEDVKEHISLWIDERLKNEASPTIQQNESKVKEETAPEEPNCTEQRNDKYRTALCVGFLILNKHKRQQKQKLSRVWKH